MIEITNMLEKIMKYRLVKEIVSRQGVVHFRRYKIMETPWFALYIHQICQSDMDQDPHDHPWDFESLILKGAYTEVYLDPECPEESISCSYYRGDVVKHKSTDAHKITLLTDEVWTLVYTTGNRRDWGYLTAKGWVDHITYRKQKNADRDGKFI